MKLKKYTFKKVNSTNDTAIKIIKNSNCKSGIIIADEQKKGKGQRGKKWISYKGNIFVSVFFALDKINLSIAHLTKLNCFLIKKILSSYCKKKITVKFPNDLVVKKNKICGILQETIKKTNTTYMIVGIGINLIKSPNIKNYPTTNFLKLTKSKINKKKVILEIKKIYEIFIPRFSEMKFQTINKI